MLVCMKNCPHFALKFCVQNFNAKCVQYSCSKKCFERHEELRFFDVALLGLFSRRFGAGKQVGAQSSFLDVELLEDFIASWV